MATVVLTPASGQVTASQANMPLLITPSAITGLGSLTLAEMQSSRIYADEAKLVEQAREAVSNDECHTKVASLTTSSKVVFDYDGIRSDYATTATYGAEAVWGAYGGVWHMQESTTAIVDSTGNAGDASSVGSPAMRDTSAPFGQYSAHLKPNSELTIPHNLAQNYGVTSFGMQIWYARAANGTYNTPMFRGPSQPRLQFLQDDRVSNDYFRFLTIDTSTNLEDLFKNPLNAVNNKWFLIHVDRNQSLGTLNMWVDGTVAASEADTNGSADSNSNIQMGTADTRQDFKIREYRMRSGSFSNDWITIEYNNQSDNGAFWEVGGTPPGPDYTITAETGAFAATGQSADLLAQYRLTADHATFTLSGQPANVLHNRLLTAETGAFALSGTPANFTRALRLACETGAFTLAGSPANILGRYHFAADTGTFTLDGQNASIKVRYVVTAQSASFTLSGSPTSILARFRLPVGVGAFTLSGNEAEITKVAYVHPFCPVDGPFESAESPFTSFAQGECD